MWDDGRVTQLADCPYRDDVLQYYYMEYNAIKGGEEFRSDIFEP